MINGQAYYSRGKAYHCLGDYEQAQHDFKTANSLNIEWSFGYN